MRIPHSIDEKTRTIGGNGSRTNFKNTEFLASSASLNEEIVKFLIDESSEVIRDPEILKQVITEHDVKQYIEHFKTKKRDSKEYIEALNFLETYFDKSNKKTIDL